MAGEAAVLAFESNDFSERQLWQYNLDFVERYGNKTAGLEAFRLYLQTLTNKEINYGMRHFLSVSEATGISLGEMPELSSSQKLAKLFRGLGSYKAFKGLLLTMDRMKRLNQLYKDYPKEPEQFEQWKKQVDALLNDVRTHYN